jgi:flagellar motor switch protein FliM
MVVEPIMSKLTTKFWYSLVEKEPISNAREMLEYKLENTIAPVRGILGGSAITVAELLSLSPGDVLPLNRGVRDEVDVYIGELLKFKARPGVIHKKAALRVTRVYKKEDM